RRETRSRRDALPPRPPPRLPDRRRPPAVRGRPPPRPGAGRPRDRRPDRDPRPRRQVDQLDERLRRAARSAHGPAVRRRRGRHAGDDRRHRRGAGRGRSGGRAVSAPTRPIVPWPPGAAYRKRPPLGELLGDALRPLLVPAAWMLGTVTAIVLVTSAVFGFHYRELTAVAAPSGGVQPLAGERHGSAAPTGLYIAVDTGGNRLYLKRGESTLLNAVCSTGTGGVLADPASGRRWTFDTPHGTYRVLAKVHNPIWHKPDWAFVEEGKPI